MTRETDNAAFVNDLQAELGVKVDGWAGAKTRVAFAERFGVELRPPRPAALATFHGDLERVHAWEGHNGSVYWPGGASGVTLDPGFDLGHQTEESLRRFYGAILLPHQLEDLAGVVGMVGADAKTAARWPRFAGIRVSRSAADRIFPHLAADYWQAIVKRFPALANADTPGSVQTAFLSLAYNRGPWNPGLDHLYRPVAARDWPRVADLIGDMQQDHQLASISRRRREEAGLIRDELA